MRAVLIAILWLAYAACGHARDYVEVVGSSTVYHFSTLVAEQLGRNSYYKTPVVESIGSGGGLKRFCAGVGFRFPDIANASRRITDDEVAVCDANQVRHITEVQLGFDGIVVVNVQQAPALALTRQELYRALAKYLPADDGSQTVVENPYTHWHQINPALPPLAISVYGPPRGSGTQDGLVDLVLTAECLQHEWLAALSLVNAARFEDLCKQLRDDGRYVSVGENDNLTVQRLSQNPSAMGILGFSVYEKHRHLLKPATIEGYQPTFSTIGTGLYPIARPLYFYVKREHVDLVPGLREYIALFTSESMIGASGLLSAQGMVPMAKPYRERQRRFLQASGLLTEDAGQSHVF